MFAFLMVASMMFLPLNPASAQSSSWTDVSSNLGSKMEVKYKTTDWDSGKKVCKNVNVQIKNKDKTIKKATMKTKFKDTGREDSRGLGYVGANETKQYVIPLESGKGGCIVEYVKFESVEN